MLESSSFTKLLTGAKELKKIVDAVVNTRRPPAPMMTWTVRRQAGRFGVGVDGSAAPPCRLMGVPWHPVRDSVSPSLARALRSLAAAAAAAAAAQTVCRVCPMHACLQKLMRWMDECEIVARLLRSGLHQRQYMEEVRVCTALCAEHLTT
jgi:hypothetical protein